MEQQVLEALGILENSELILLVELGVNPCTSRKRIRPDLPPSLLGRFWRSGIPI
jgi:hypothetical protein